MISGLPSGFTESVVKAANEAINKPNLQSGNKEVIHPATRPELSFNGIKGVSFGNVSEDPARRQRLLDNIYNALGARTYENSLPKTLDELTKFAADYGIPTFANGGVTKGVSIAGEAGSESIFNYEQMKNMYDYIKMVTQPRTNINNNSQDSSYTFNVVINSQNGNPRQISQELENTFTKKINQIATNRRI